MSKNQELNLILNEISVHEISESFLRKHNLSDESKITLFLQLFFLEEYIVKILFVENSLEDSLQYVCHTNKEAVRNGHNYFTTLAEEINIYHMVSGKKNFCPKTYTKKYLDFINKVLNESMSARLHCSSYFILKTMSIANTSNILLNLFPFIQKITDNERVSLESFFLFKQNKIQKELTNCLERDGIEIKNNPALEKLALKISKAHLEFLDSLWEGVFEKDSSSFFKEDIILL